MESRDKQFIRALVRQHIIDQIEIFQAMAEDCPDEEVNVSETAVRNCAADFLREYCDEFAAAVQQEVRAVNFQVRSKMTRHVEVEYQFGGEDVNVVK